METEMMPEAGEGGPPSSSSAGAVSEEPQPAEASAEPAEESPGAAGEEAGEGPAEEAAEEARPPPLEGAAPSEEPPPPAAAEDEEGGGGEEEAAPAAPAAGTPPEAAAAAEGEGEPEEVPSSLALVREASLPTSQSFSEGEPREPSPLQVGVPLGRRISQSLRELERRSSRASLEAGGSPEAEEDAAAAAGGEEAAAAAAEARRAEEQRQRAELAEQYRQLVSERGRLRRYNSKLQGRLAELLNKAKGKERARAELEQHISDKEQRYGRYLAMLEELRGQQEEEEAWYQKQLASLRKACDEKLAKVDGQWQAFQAVKKEVAVFTMGRRLGGRQAAIKQVEQIQNREQSKEKEVTEVRLENIKLKHRIQRLEVSLKAQEELAEGLHLIDFEQLKIENQTYNEKIEERNEELQKLRRKITNTVQVLTQVKEKLQFVEAKNQSQKAQLMAVEALVAQKRDLLTRTKQARDRLRMDNEKLQQRCGLLGNTLLLRDFENKADAAEELNARLEQLKHRHAGLALACQGVKKKIRGVKSFLPF